MRVVCFNGAERVGERGVARERSMMVVWCSSRIDEARAAESAGLGRVEVLRLGISCSTLDPTDDDDDDDSRDHSIPPHILVDSRTLYEPHDQRSSYDTQLPAHRPPFDGSQTPRPLAAFRRFPDSSSAASSLSKDFDSVFHCLLGSAATAPNKAESSQSILPGWRRIGGLRSLRRSSSFALDSHGPESHLKLGATKYSSRCLKCIER